AVGNMRQPNHLATALICAMVWTVWWMAEAWHATSGPDARRARRRLVLVLGLTLAALLAALAGSASRTGAISLALLLLWAVLDRRLPGPVRLLACHRKLKPAPSHRQVQRVAVTACVAMAVGPGHRRFAHRHHVGRQQIPVVVPDDGVGGRRQQADIGRV
ncbi:pilin glycosylation ligase domain-containing protein, partial [Escherichia coli]|nr:pilin glycosylation ligase domain-containing protein [Escherichia coli]